MNRRCPKCHSPCSEEALYCPKCYTLLKKSLDSSRSALLEVKPSVFRRPISRPLILFVFGAILIGFVDWTLGKAIEMRDALNQKVESDLTIASLNPRIEISKLVVETDDLPFEYEESVDSLLEVEEVTTEEEVDKSLDFIESRVLPSLEGWTDWMTTNFVVWTEAQAIPPGYILDLEALYAGITVDFPFFTEELDRKIQFYLFQNKNSYLSSKTLPPWSSGVAFPKHQIILTYEQTALMSVTAHELAHLLFEGFVQSENQHHRWLVEGMAVYAEIHYVRRPPSWFNQEIRMFARGDGLSVQNVITFPPSHRTPPQAASMWYAQSYSLTRYLIEVTSSTSFRIFMEGLAEGKDITEALSEAYGNGLGTYESFEENWRTWLRNQ